MRGTGRLGKANVPAVFEEFTGFEQRGQASVISPRPLAWASVEAQPAPPCGSWRDRARRGRAEHTGAAWSPGPRAGPTSASATCLLSDLGKAPSPRCASVLSSVNVTYLAGLLRRLNELMYAGHVEWQWAYSKRANSTGH